jgi:hypothetical protein
VVCGFFYGAVSIQTKETADAPRLTQQLPSGRIGVRHISRQSEFSIYVVSYIYIYIYIYIYKGAQLKYKLSTYWKLIGRSLTVLLPVSAPSSIHLLPSSHCNFIPAWTKSARLKNAVIYLYIRLFTFRKLRGFGILVT